MASEKLSVALLAPASSPVNPMAKPGYGKRSTPGQAPRRTDDFLLLPERERYIAAFVDRLPDGAAMNVKSLAKQLPFYGQQAVSTALTALSVAGHLRRVRRPVGEGEQVRWVFRTFWSRTARDNEWWTAYLSTECTPEAVPEAAPEAAPPPHWVPVEETQAEEPPGEETQAEEPPGGEARGEETRADETPPPHPPAREAPTTREAPPAAEAPAPDSPTSSSSLSPSHSDFPAPESPSPAYVALALLGRTEPRLALSAADCAALEEPAAAWLARGVSTDHLIHALTSGLPDVVNVPRGFVRRRLHDKMPPRLPATAMAATTSPASPAPALEAVRRTMVECTECGVPGRPEALPDGLCRTCRPAPSGGPESAPGPAPDPAAEAIAARDVHALVGHLRVLTRTP
ncbi:MarR family transcriptional regulator [Streptomyces sp. NBC_00654]|uniref:MarR family transcriptional regulator n=1 Tax=Streptomyces sp. NBC_00654 TaxID=2975799 RepID=UPI00225B8004|nr:MarR family transcriptional regulator [Streptomyces sp. NBC_00654]MCX4965510.1 MarR family transcriptional regulator [Streptomyces sp. NBC_00654]